MSAPQPQVPAEARAGVDVLARLVATLISSGYSTDEAFILGESAALGLDLGDAALIDLGTAVTVEYVDPAGSTIARTRTVDTLGSIDCQSMKDCTSSSDRSPRDGSTPPDCTTNWTVSTGVRDRIRG